MGRRGPGRPRGDLKVGPLRDWLERRIAEAGVDEVAGKIGINERALWRIRYENLYVTSGLVDRWLLNWSDGTRIDDLYPLEQEDNDRGFCPRCHEEVPTEDGRCLWCDSQVGGKAFYLWCPKEDVLRIPAGDGSCWRCGTKLKTSAPFVYCECGCGTVRPRFDPQRRRARYVHGHGPSLGPTAWRPVDAEPFRQWLRERLEDLDVIRALAQQTGLARDHVAQILNGDEPTVERERVRKALWTFARGGTGKGLAPHPDATKFFDLYPEDARNRVCRGCGGGKAPHAELCKNCRRKQNRIDGIAPNGAVTRISDELAAEAYRIYCDEDISLMAVAERITERTPHSNAGSTAQALSRLWKQRGWELRRRNNSETNGDGTDG